MDWVQKIELVGENFYKLISTFAEENHSRNVRLLETPVDHWVSIIIIIITYITKLSWLFTMFMVKIILIISVTLQVTNWI